MAKNTMVTDGKAPTALFKFSFETLRNFANDPTSGEFISLVLHKASGITPLSTDKFDMGSFKNQDGANITTIIQGAYQAINPDKTVGIYGPDPYPAIDLEDVIHHSQQVVVDGLNNVLVEDFLSYNYDEAHPKVTAVIPLVFNEWSVDESAHKIMNKKSGTTYDHWQKLTSKQLQTLNVNTPFHITQYFKVNGGKATVSLDGTFSFQIPDLSVQGTLEITVSESGGNRTGLAMNISKLELKTPEQMTFAKVEVNAAAGTDEHYKKVLGSIFKEVLKSAEGTQSIISDLQKLINSSGNLSQLNKLLNEKFTDVVDSKLGKVSPALIGPYDGPSDGNRVDYYLFDRIRYALVSKDSPWFLQTVLKKYKHPSLYPQFKPSDLDIGSYTLPGAGIKLNNITLSGIVITGLPNAMVSKKDMRLGPPLYMTMIMGDTDSFGTTCNTTASATFKADYDGGSLDIGLNVQIQGCRIAATVRASGPDDDHLDITVESLQFSIPETKDLHITLDHPGGLGAFVQKILNTSPIQNKIVSAVNSQFKDHLSMISKELTKIAKELFSKQIG